MKNQENAIVSRLFRDMDSVFKTRQYKEVKELESLESDIYEIQDAIDEYQLNKYFN